MERGRPYGRRAWRWRAIFASARNERSARQRNRWDLAERPIHYDASRLIRFANRHVQYRSSWRHTDRHEEEFYYSADTDAVGSGLTFEP